MGSVPSRVSEKTTASNFPIRVGRLALDRRRTRAFVVDFLSMPYARRWGVKLPPRSLLLAGGGAAPQGNGGAGGELRGKGLAVSRPLRRGAAQALGAVA